MRRLSILAGIQLTVAAGALPAQTRPLPEPPETPARPVLPPTGPESNAPGGLKISDGEPLSFILEHATILDLTEAQRTTLMNIRRVLRRANDPYMQRLDSLRQFVGLSMDPRSRLTGDDRDKLARLDSLSSPVADTIRMNNDAATIRARAVLDSAQIVRLDSIIVQGRGGGEGRRSRPPRS